MQKLGLNQLCFHSTLLLTQGGVSKPPRNSKESISPEHCSALKSTALCPVLALPDNWAPYGEKEPSFFLVMVFVETSLSACPGTRHYQVCICLSACVPFRPHCLWDVSHPLRSFQSPPCSTSCSFLRGLAKHVTKQCVPHTQTAGLAWGQALCTTTMYHNSRELQDPIGMVQVEEQGVGSQQGGFLCSSLPQNSFVPCLILVITGAMELIC